MGNICQCTIGKRNTAPNSCPDLLQIGKRLIIVPKYKNDGTVNEFANVAAVTKAALKAKFDAADIDDRFFPLAEFVNVEDTKAESVYEEFTDKTKIKIDEGKRIFTGFITNQGSRYLEKLKTWGCVEFGVFVIDKNSNFAYETDSTTKLKVKPIMVDNNSLEVILVKATDTTVEKIKVSFDFSHTTMDDYLRYIPFESLDFNGLDTADVYGLYDTEGTASAISTTGFTMTIVTDYGLPVKGLLTGDFALYNVTDSASVTAVTFAESADGVYAFTFAAQTPADVLRCTPTKAKYDFAGVISEVITIP
jgi:VCBS repeat-containing protein